MITIKAINNNVILKKVKAAEQTAGGIFIPQVVDTQCIEGLVISFDDSEGSDVSGISIGDTVLYDVDKAVTFSYNNESYVSVNNSDIFGVLIKG